MPTKCQKHARDLLLYGTKIESRIKLYMTHLGVNESEVFINSVSIYNRYIGSVMSELLR